MIRVVLADDQPLVRAGLRTLLDRSDDIRVVGEAADGEAALALAASERPEVARDRAQLVVAAYQGGLVGRG